MNRTVGTALAALLLSAALMSTSLIPGFAFGRLLHRSAPSGSSFFCTQPQVVNGVTLKGDCYSIPTH